MASSAKQALQGRRQPRISFAGRLIISNLPDALDQRTVATLCVAGDDFRQLRRIDVQLRITGALWQHQPGRPSAAEGHDLAGGDAPIWAAICPLFG